MPFDWRGKLRESFADYVLQKFWAFVFVVVLSLTGLIVAVVIGAGPWAWRLQGASLAALVVVAFFLLLARAHARQKWMGSTLVTAPAAKAIDPTTVESLQRLREIYPSIRQAIDCAYDYLWADLRLVGANSKIPEHEIIAGVLDRYFMSIWRDHNKSLSESMALHNAPISATEFAGLVDLCGATLSRYYEGLRWIVIAGSVWVGRERLLSSPKYAKLHGLHAKCMGDLTMISGRSDFGRLGHEAPSLLGILPPPQQSP